MIHQRKISLVTGADNADFLNGQLTIAIRREMPLTYGALLSPQGKILADLFVWGQGEILYVDLPASEYAAITARLNMYKMRADVVFAEAELTAYQVVPGDDPRNSGLGGRVYSATPPDDLMGEEEYVSRRVANLVPDFRADFAANEAYPIEWRFAQMGGIDYKKGCYVGQEIAARMRHKTTLQKTVMGFELSGVVTPQTPITVGQKTIGRVLTVAGNRALAFVKISAMGDGMNAAGVSLTDNIAAS